MLQQHSIRLVHTMRDRLLLHLMHELSHYKYNQHALYRCTEYLYSTLVVHTGRQDAVSPHCQLGVVLARKSSHTDIPACVH